MKVAGELREYLERNHLTLDLVDGKPAVMDEQDLVICAGQLCIRCSEKPCCSIRALVILVKYPTFRVKGNIVGHFRPELFSRLPPVFIIFLVMMNYIFNLSYQ